MSAGGRPAWKRLRVAAGRPGEGFCSGFWQQQLGTLSDEAPKGVMPFRSRACTNRAASSAPYGWLAGIVRAVHEGRRCSAVQVRPQHGQRWWLAAVHQPQRCPAPRAAEVRRLGLRQPPLPRAAGWRAAGGGRVGRTACAAQRPGGATQVSTRPPSLAAEQHPSTWLLPRRRFPAPEPSKDAWIARSC